MELDEERDKNKRFEQDVSLDKRALKKKCDDYENHFKQLNK
jgi:hypothetical protein